MPNEIYPFGSTGTVEDGDLQSLAAYILDAHRLKGNQPGIARRDLVNRVLRQCSHMSAGLAQFIANRYAPGVVDDGVLDKIEAGLVAAIEAMIADAMGGLVGFEPLDPNLLRRNVHARLEAAYTSAVRTANASGNITVDLNTQEGLQVLTLTGAATLDALVADGGGTAVIWVVPGGHALSINTANFRVIDDSKPLSLTREMILQLQYRGTGRCDLAIQYAGV